MAAADFDSTSDDASDGAGSYIELMPNPTADHVSLYPIGKRYFDLSIALMVSAEPRVSSNNEDFESRFTVLSREYGFEDCIVVLRSLFPQFTTNEPIGTSSDAITEFYIILGSVCQRGNREDRQKLASTLCQFRVEPPRSEPRSGRTLRNTSMERTERRTNIPPVAARQETTDIPTQQSQQLVDGRAATALNEYGQQIGTLPGCSTTKISSDPPLSRTVLVFDGREFTATGRNKKLAQHAAAASACQALGVEVS